MGPCDRARDTKLPLAPRLVVVVAISAHETLLETRLLIDKRSKYIIPIVVHDSECVT